jgi:ferric-dicitrate binding protein FerR (iron transport regulator)
VAAAVAILLGVFGWMWQWQSGSAGKSLVAFRWDTLANPGNDIKQLSMTDGSIIWLAPHSALVYNQQYNETSRELWLKGEAFFDVSHDPGRPFKVHTGKLITTVLGTAFNIATSNKADGSIQISLVEGKVSVTAADRSYILNPGEMLDYKDTATGLTPLPFNAQEVMDWKQGKLVFDKTPLADVFAKLQSRLGCKIIVDPALKSNRKVSGIFPVSTPVINILEAMQYVHGFTIEKKGGNTYAIKAP